jgi:hypothetical protein
MVPGCGVCGTAGTIKGLERPRTTSEAHSMRIYCKPGPAAQNNRSRRILAIRDYMARSNASTVGQSAELLSVVRVRRERPGGSRSGRGRKVLITGSIFLELTSALRRLLRRARCRWPKTHPSSCGAPVQKPFSSVRSVAAVAALHVGGWHGQVSRPRLSPEVLLYSSQRRQRRRSPSSSSSAMTFRPRVSMAGNVVVPT